MLMDDILIFHPDGRPSTRDIPPEGRHWDGKSTEESKVSFPAVTLFDVCHILN